MTSSAVRIWLFSFSAVSHRMVTLFRNAFLSYAMSLYLRLKQQIVVVCAGLEIAVPAVLGHRVG